MDLSVAANVRPPMDRRPDIVVMPRFPSLLNLDHPSHMRVQGTKIVVVAGGREGEGVTVVRIQGLRLEFSRGYHRVRDVVLVLPGHGRADFHGEFGGREGEVVDGHYHLFAMCPGDLQRHGRCNRDAEAASAQEQ